jgi:TRAP transporter TAXI family solute receptor
MNAKGRYLKGLGVLLIITLLSFGLANDATAAKSKFLIIGGGNTGGLYYPMAGVFASLVNKNIKGFRASAEVTGASNDNCIYIGEKKMDIGFANSDTILYALNGEKPQFQKKYDLQVLFETFTSNVLFWVLKDSPFKGIGDLKGKRISVGSPGSGTIWKSKFVLEAYGITFEQIKPAYLTFSEGVDALIDHNVDAVVLFVAPTSSACIDLTARATARLLPYAEDAREFIVKKHPYLKKGTVPGGILKGVPNDVPIIASGNPCFVHKDFDPDFAYNFTKLIADNIPYIHRVLPTLKGELELRSMPTIPKIFTYHPGAVKFFKEKNLMQ